MLQKQACGCQEYGEELQEVFPLEDVSLDSQGEALNPFLDQEEEHHEQKQDLERACDRGHPGHEAAGERLRLVLDRFERVIEVLAEVDGVGIGVLVHLGDKVGVSFAWVAIQ